MNAVYRSRAFSGMLFLTALALGACASLLPKLEPPAMTLEAVRIARITPEETRLMLTLTLDNPNDRAVMIDALDFTLTVAGAAVASAVLTRPIALPAHGEAQAEIAAQTTFASLGAALDATARERAFSYELAGRAIVDGRTLPFVRRGRKSFAESMGGSR